MKTKILISTVLVFYSLTGQCGDTVGNGGDSDRPKIEQLKNKVPLAWKHAINQLYSCQEVTSSAVINEMLEIVRFLEANSLPNESSLNSPHDESSYLRGWAHKILIELIQLTQTKLSLPTSPYELSNLILDGKCEGLN